MIKLLGVHSLCHISVVYETLTRDSQQRHVSSHLSILFFSLLSVALVWHVASNEERARRHLGFELYSKLWKRLAPVALLETFLRAFSSLCLLAYSLLCKLMSVAGLL